MPRKRPFQEANSLGARLSGERHRLGLTQTELAIRGSVRRQTQAHYERNSRNPDGAYLGAIAEAGVDVLYVLTGRHERQPLNQDLLQGVLIVVEELLGRLRVDLQPETKARIIANLYSTSESKNAVDRDLAEAFIKIASAAPRG
jgi:transcriptional regulator with XRE-family HTH domain